MYSLTFHLIGELNHPWRWTNAGGRRSSVAGFWTAGGCLLNGNAIDLRRALPGWHWYRYGRNRRSAASCRRPDARSPRTGKVLVISYDTRASADGQPDPGATTVQAVDLVDLTDFGAAFNTEAADALTRTVQFATNVMTRLARSIAARRKRYERASPQPADGCQKRRYGICGEPGFMLAAEALRFWPPRIMRAGLSVRGFALLFARLAVGCCRRLHICRRHGKASANAIATRVDHWPGV